MSGMIRMLKMEFVNQVEDPDYSPSMQCFKCGCKRLLLKGGDEMWFILCKEHFVIYKKAYMTVTLELRQLVTGDFLK